MITVETLKEKLVDVEAELTALEKRKEHLLARKEVFKELIQEQTGTPANNDSSIIV